MSETKLFQSGVPRVDGSVPTRDALIEMAKKNNWRIQTLPNGEVEVYVTTPVTEYPILELPNK